MAQTDVKEIASQIKKGEFKNLYYFYGRNVSGVESITRLLIKAAVGDNDDIALTKIDGKNIDVSSFRDVIEMLPMMCDYNCVFINDYNCDEQREETTKALIDALKNVPEQTIVVFNATGFDVKCGKKSVSPKNKKLIDFIAKNGITCEQELKSSSELAKSIIGSVSKRGCEISFKTAQQLAEMCLCNSLMINNEIDKLCSYVNGKEEITSDILKLMVAQQSDATVYSLANAVAAFNKKAAFEALDELMSQKVSRGAILNAISSSFIDLYRASAARNNGRNVGEMFRDFEYARDFVVKNAFRDCTKISIARLRKCIIILRDTAVTLNTTATDERVALEQAIAKMLIAK
jgi:DNA polymerase-3 subunit delta